MCGEKKEQQQHVQPLTFQTNSIFLTQQNFHLDAFFARVQDHSGSCGGGCFAEPLKCRKQRTWLPWEVSKSILSRLSLGNESSGQGPTTHPCHYVRRAYFAHTFCIDVRTSFCIYANTVLSIYLQRARWRRERLLSLARTQFHALNNNLCKRKLFRAASSAFC